MCCQPGIEPRFGDIQLKDVNMSDGGLSAEEPRVSLKKFLKRKGRKCVYRSHTVHRNIGLD